MVCFARAGVELKYDLWFSIFGFYLVPSWGFEMKCSNILAMINLVLSNRQLFKLQMVSTSTSLAPDCQLKCHTSANSILHYGQYVILSIGNFLCFAQTGNSTMDFSTLPLNDEVVDSPPERKRRSRVSCSPSPLHSRGVQNLLMVPTDSIKVMQRKLYKDANFPTI